MIVDFHTHLVAPGWEPDVYYLSIARIGAQAIARQSGTAPDPAIIKETLLKRMSDTSGEKLIAEMDSAGVDLSVIHVLDFDLGVRERGLGRMEIEIEEKNKKHFEIQANHPDRIVSFFGIDPRREGAMALFEKAVEEWGMKGLKLHPTSGYYPDDLICFPLYDYAQKKGLPVLFHTGSQPYPWRAKFAQPVYVDSVAAEFPELTIIAAHLGHGWWEELLHLAGAKPNIHVDISGWQITLQHDPETFYTVLRRYLDALGPWRVLFGSDGPFLNALMPLKDWVDAIKNPKTKIPFSKEETDIVLGKTASKILKKGF